MKGKLNFGSRYRKALALIFLFTSCPAAADAGDSISGIVRDSSNAVVANASVTLLNAQQAIIASAKTDSEGRFVFSDIREGTYALVVSARGFSEQRIAVNVSSSDKLEIILEPDRIAEEITVAANQGVVESVESLSQQVNVINERDIAERAKSVVAQAVSEEVGIHLQRTGSTMSGIFIRGVTGNKVNVFIDGVRYSTSAQRGGVNTFLNLLSASNFQSLEVLRGPNSAQYGSDSIGGSVQFISRTVAYSPAGFDVHARAGVSFNSADLGSGSDLTTTFAAKKFSLLATVAGHRSNTIRPGGGVDSHNAVTRFFGLNSDIVIDDRLPDTAFTQYGGLLKLNYSPAAGSNFIAGYMRGQQDGGKRFDQLLGGDGNLVADLRNLMNDFFYVRYDRAGMGWLDGVTLAYSLNAQREERVNQGGNGNPKASINHEFEKTYAHGFQVFANKLFGSRQNVVVGADYYRERIDAPSFAFNPVSEAATLRRGRVPDNSRYHSGGIYAQDVIEAIPGKLRLMGNIRWSAASYKSRAADSPVVNGKRLWPDDSLRVDDVTFRAGVVVTPIEGFHLLANISRGFRAPHMTDLGTLGLTGSSFEVAAPDVAGLRATIGSSAASSAVSTGIGVTQVGPETSMNYEVGARFRNRRFDTDFAFFVTDIDENIVKQALILPPGAVGRRLGDEVITEQNANGVVFVAASPNPVLVRANFDDARIYGFEHKLDVLVTDKWSAATVFTYIRARDKRTDLPPNIEGGTPAPDGYLKIRYTSAGRKFWIEPYLHAAGRQDRLSSLDLDDRRTGAGRSRSGIANFFNNGARARGLVSAGADGVAGTADDVLRATGETLSQIQNRVLGVGVNSSSLFTAIPGYITFNVRGGFRFAERHEVLIDFENISDRNYRGISWGVDAPGRGVFIRYNTRF